MVAGVVSVTAIKFPPALDDFEGWTEKKRILVILAHPDDPDFFCGASIARWADLGHQVTYCLITQGQKGSQDPTQTTESLAKLRREEQDAAAKLLGVQAVEYLDYVDGELIPDLEMRKKVVRIIRKAAAQVVVTCDPQNLFPNDHRVNHPDHRAAGQVVIDALFPAAGNPMFYPELESKEGLSPVHVEELWLSLTTQPNLILDMSHFFEQKINAILCHRSQVGEDINKLTTLLRSRFVHDPETGQEYYPESFKRITFDK